jgi:hypothetical protein
MRKVGSRRRAEGRRTRAVRLFLVYSAYGLLPTVYCLTTGCADNSSASGSDPTDRAMRDPMHYRPEFEKRGGADARSSGSSGSSDKDGLGKDLDHVFNP